MSMVDSDVGGGGSKARPILGCRVIVVLSKGTIYFMLVQTLPYKFLFAFHSKTKVKFNLKFEIIFLNN